MNPENPASADDGLSHPALSDEFVLEEANPVMRDEVDSPRITPPCKMKEESPLQDEIESMRIALQRLVESFSRVETLKACPELVEGSS